MTFRMESRIPPLLRNNPDETTDKSIDHKRNLIYATVF